MKSVVIESGEMEMSSSNASIGDPRTPSKPGNNSGQEGTIENTTVHETQEGSRRNTLRLDTQLSGPPGPGTRRVSPTGTIGASSVSSTSNHSRQDSSASYTPLRSARGSLSLGGTAHHSVLSRRSSLSQSGISREAWALPLANTDSLILVPDAVATRSPLCAQTNAEYPEITEARTPQRGEESRPTLRRQRKSSRQRELRNAAILVGMLCVLLVTALSMYIAMALPKVKDIPASIHVFIIGTFVLLLALIILFSYRFHKALKRHKIEKTQGLAGRHRRSRTVRPTETEESLIPNSPIMVRYEADDDVERPEHGSPANIRPPPPAYGRWRGSYRMDPELLHWRRVGDAEEDEQRSTVDTAPPMYASPLRSNRPEGFRRQDEVVGATEMVEVGRAY